MFSESDEVLPNPTVGRCGTITLISLFQERKRPSRASPVEFSIEDEDLLVWEDGARRYNIYTAVSNDENGIGLALDEGIVEIASCREDCLGDRVLGINRDVI